MKQQNDILQPVSIEEIQKMLEAKSLALEKLQSELEVESALERVRAVAMSMKKSEDLFDVCKVMYEELTALNFTNIRNAQIAINLGQYKSWLIFEYSKYGEIKMKKVDSSISPLLKEIAEEMSTTKDAHRLFQKQIKGEEFKKWRAWRLKEDALKDPRVEEANSMCFYLHGIEAGILGISSFDAITNEQVEILNRFKNVFDLSYRRYADVAKAEAQAREAQIELGLERVRARAMAMQKSDDLAGAVAIIFEELDKLDIGILRCGIGILNKENRSVNVWTTSISDENVPVQISGDQSMDSHPLLQGAFNAWLKQEDYSYILQGKDLTDYYKAQAGANFKLPDSQSLITANEGLCQYYFLATFQAGGLFAFRESPFPEEGKKVMKRFADVFNLTYKRFSDLKTAEAQAREAQIEAALEKVRSRSLAMHKSDELQEVVNTLFEKLQELDIQADSANIAIFKEGTRDYDYWVASHFQKRAASFHMPYNDLLLTRDLIAARESGTDFSTKAYSFEEKNEWFNYAFINTDFKFLSEERKQFILGSKGISVSIAFGKNTGVQVVNYSGNLLSETEADILKRFSRVFEQAYTRFLDLQKAEAQARESRIEAALEKVRSRSLAMHKSDEIQEVLHAVFEKMKELDIDFYTAIIILFTKGSKNIIWWLESRANRLYPRILVPYADIDYLKKLFEARDNGMELFSKCYSFEEKNELFHHLFKHTDFKDAPEEQKKFLLETGFATMSVALAKNTGIHLTSYSKESFSEQDNEVLKRFAKVFEQAYTRFLDLQQAEAQARESQIQLALERVRARTMAMQKSEELKEVIQSVYDQFGHLNIHIEHTGFIMDYKARDDMHIWLADKHAVPFQVTIPYFDCAHWNSFNEAKEKGTDFFANQLNFEEKNTFYQDLFKLIPGVPEETKEYYLNCPGLAISTVLLENIGLYIENFSGVPYTDEENDTLMRFGKVFQQTYTRFLDLQKAEAQVREAKIEAALERTRTQSMIMQHSKELDDTLRVFHEQVLLLGIPSAFSFLWLPDEEKEQHIFWAVWAENISPTQLVDHRSTVFKSKAINYPLDRNEPATAQCLVDWKGNEPIVSYHVPPPGVESYFAAWQELIDGVEQLKPEYFQDGLYYVEAFMKYGCFGVMVATDLTEDEKKILGRFAIEFERTYTRFLDLQKAEAQARESQIQLALERVRARTMAMQKSDELRETVLVIYEQLQQLGFDSNACNIIIINKESGEMQYWVSGFTQKVFPEGYHVPYLHHPYHEKLLTAFRKNEKYAIMEYTGEMKKSFDKVFFTETEFRNIPEEAKKFMKGLESVKLSTAFFSFGALQILGPMELTREKAIIFQRFAKVFNQTYTRFLDLQKAEAQARESQIQLALERVRARTMAMQKSEELEECAVLLFQQIGALGINAWSAGFSIWRDDDTYFIGYNTNPTGGIGAPFVIPLTEDVFFKTIREAKRRGEEFLVFESDGESLVKTYRYMDTLPIVGDVMRGVVSAGYELPKYQVTHCGFFPEGHLMFITLEPHPEAWDLFKRFTKVFQQTYTRFLDLQKAEAQARESQIQLGLERVRARAMAMQHSDHLKDVIEVIGHQLHELGLYFDYVNFVVGDTTNGFDTWNVSFGQTNPVRFFIPYINNRLFNEMLKVRKDGLEFNAYTMTEEETFIFVTHLIENGILKYLPEEALQKRLHSKGMSVATAVLNEVFLTMANYSAIPYTDEENSILKRFGNAFQQAFTRFLDLQKAEAQARESQIEAVLERVRSRTMAMQKSDELTDVAGLLFEQVSALGIKTWTAGFNVWSEDNDSYVDYITSPNGGFIEPYTVHTERAEALRDISNARKSGVEFDVQYVEGEKIKHLYLALTRLDEKQYEIMLQDGVRFPSHQYEHFVFGSKVSLMFITYEPVPEAHDIFKRLGKVFEQTYTRFLDLQKAEAQAREAQIQLGLERVRARAMAMQNSDELNPLIGTLFVELTKLDLQLTRCVIMIMNPQTKSCRWWMANSEAPETPMNFFVKYHKHPPYLAYLEGWHERKLKWEYIIEGAIKKNWDDFIFSETELSLLPDFVIAGMRLPERVYLNASFNNFGNLTLASLEPLSIEHADILLRFAKVFDLTYTRFNDLQTAEAQARESQIQLALERVRARTMAMHNSSELADTTGVLFQQFMNLGITPKRCLIGIMDKKNQSCEFFYTGFDGKVIPSPDLVPMNEQENLKQLYNAWMKNKDHLYFKLVGQQRVNWTTYIMNNAKMQFPEYKPDKINLKQISSVPAVFNTFFFTQGFIMLHTVDEIPEPEISMLKRFSGVFEQTYTRFLDLQKAEGQARESQIQLALERVRARTMAMQKSDELAETASLLFKQINDLGIQTWTSGFNIWEKEDTSFIGYNPTPSGEIAAPYHIPSKEDNFFYTIHQAKKRGDDFFVFESSGDSLTETYKYMKTLPVVKEVLKGIEDSGFQLPIFQINHCAFFTQGFLLFITLHPYPEAHDIFKRFGKVFEQTYTRFLDLQKAEAQAKESQIQLALERVRARTMAMQHSDELKNAAALLFQQVKSLGVPAYSCGYNIWEKKDKTFTSWMSTQDGSIINGVPDIPLTEDSNFIRYVESKQKGEQFFVLELRGERMQEHYEYLKTIPAFKAYFDYAESVGFDLPETQIHYLANFSQGNLLFITLEPCPEFHDVFKRFASVFEQTYTRFLDLQKAEAQAREATIEAALEKVRGKAMAMHDSNDVSSTASLVFTELRKLGINPIRCGVGLLTKDSRKGQLYSATSSADGDSLALIGWVQLSDHPVLTKIYDTWLNDEEYYPELQGEEMQTYYQLLLKGLPVSVPDTTDSPKQYGHFIPFSIGCLYAWSETHYNESNIKILKRFASIIDLTFRRYIELQKSEANARDAIKQSALDRIRADIASMRTTTDLERITPLIWNELTILGISFIRCGIFIMDDSQELIHTFLSTPEGKAIAAFHLPYASPGNISQVLSHWRNKKNYVDHWDKSAFTEFAEILVEQGGLASAEQYLKTVPGGGFYLHFVPFLQGMLYVGNTTQLGKEEIKLIQSVADAFSTAYARYEDFNKLEFAKQHVEKTLVDLKQAQIQLIQSEKMASLGELTAGIAHEIQNPLNFVNNFSEVNAELLVELKDEISKGNMNEAKNIANDLIDNEEKINHHGKRADAIVKGMLQHSRISTGQKEATNINTLADEYLRLAYHGMRAKDNFFNVVIKTDFDERIEKIKIIPQDIGRVILNLITNAFYAVNEKKKQQPDGYEPAICVSTKNVSGKVEIKVKDNGNGIGEKVLDKIFQPFFTTKPTGQGTGLGLSLSYDTVKAHGGEIKVESKEGEGSEFIILINR